MHAGRPPGHGPGPALDRCEGCGFGSPDETNRRMRLDRGATGLNVIFDIPTMTGMDADHPDAEEAVDVQGAWLSTVEDMAALMADLPPDGISMSIVVTSHGAPVVLATYLAVARERGIPLARLRGTIQNHPRHHRGHQGGARQGEHGRPRSRGEGAGAAAPGRGHGGGGPGEAASQAGDLIWARAGQAEGAR